jgi:hypothetical protein
VNNMKDLSCTLNWKRPSPTLRHCSAWCQASAAKYEACPESKDTSRVDRQGNFYAYYGNTAVDRDPLPVSRARLTGGRTGFV